MVNFTVDVEILSLLLLGSSLATARGQARCKAKVHDAPFLRTKYRIGFLERGVDTSFDEYNATTEYLTKTAGALFSPPLTFETVPVKLDERVIDAFSEFDFMFANPTIFSCLASESGAKSLVTQVSRREVNGETFELTKFGGVIITLADNNEVLSIKDLANKSIGLSSINGIGR